MPLFSYRKLKERVHLKMGNCHSDEVHGSAPGGLLKRKRFVSRNASCQQPKSALHEPTKGYDEEADRFHDFSSPHIDVEEEGSAPLLHSTSNIFKAQKELWDTTKYWNEETDSRVDRTLSLSMDGSCSQGSGICNSGTDRVVESEDEDEDEAYIVLHPDSETASTLTFSSNDSLVTEGTKNSALGTASSENSSHGQEGVGLRMNAVLFALQAAIKTCKDEIHEDLSPTQALI